MRSADSDGWVEVHYRPTKPEEYQYSQYAQTAANLTPAAINDFEMGFSIQGTTALAGGPAPAPFEYEVIVHVEYTVGTNQNIDTVTKTHTDVVGMSELRNALPEKSVTNKPHHRFAKTIMDVGKSIIENAAPQAIESMAKSNSQGFFSNLLAKGEQLVDAVSNPLSMIKKLMPKDMLGSAVKSFLPSLEKGAFKALPALFRLMPK
jgi:hypothetical protein